MDKPTAAQLSPQTEAALEALLAGRLTSGTDRLQVERFQEGQPKPST